MAAVTINIPNIGNVTAENAASEETLLKLLAVMQKQSKGGGKSAEDDKLKKAKEDEAKASANMTEAQKKAIKEKETATKKEAEAQKTFSGTVDSFKQVGNAVTGFGASISKSLISLSASFLTSYDSMAKDPIGAAAGLLNTGVDLMATTAKATADATSGAAKGITGWIPFVGPAIGSVVDGMNSAAKAAIDLAATITKTANNIFAAEFKKAVAEMQAFAKAGASFGGGMIEIRNIAHSSGLSMETFGKAASAAAGDFRLAGLTQADGARAMAGGMKALSTTVGKSGNAMREELLALGYSYEEQGALIGQVMALDKAAGNTRKMSDAELAATTKVYAKDLKVLADITGKDAKKAMEEAAKKGMEADIMAQLSPEEAKKFQAAYAAMPDYAKKGFLEYVSSGGTAITDQATNIAMSQNAEVEKLIKGGYDGIKDASKDASIVQKETLKQTAAAGDQQRKLNKEQGNAIGVAARLGGGMQGIADMQNQISASGQYQAEAVDETADAATKQSEATDEVTAGYQKVNKATNDFAVEMEKLVSSNMGTYAKMLGDTMKESLDVMVKAIKIAKGELNIADVGKSDAELKDKQKYSEQDKAATEAETKFREKISEGGFWESAGKKLGIGLTDEEKKLRDNATTKRQEANGVYNSEETVAGAMQQYAFGGITNTAAIFGEQGPEAAVPLPDGRSIPVTLDLKGMLENFTGGSGAASLVAASQASTEQIVRELIDAINSLKDTHAEASSSGPMADMVKHLEEMKETAFKQLEAHSDMKSLLGDQKDITQGLLNNSY